MNKRRFLHPVVSAKSQYNNTSEVYVTSDGLKRKKNVVTVKDVGV